MTVAFFAVAAFALVVVADAIRRVRQLRRQIERNNVAARKAQVRRAECFNEFCVDCKVIAAPWWTPPYRTHWFEVKL